VAAKRGAARVLPRAAPVLLRRHLKGRGFACLLAQLLNSERPRCRPALDSCVRFPIPHAAPPYSANSTTEGRALNSILVLYAQAAQRHGCASSKTSSEPEPAPCARVARHQSRRRHERISCTRPWDQPRHNRRPRSHTSRNCTARDWQGWPQEDQRMALPHHERGPVGARRLAGSANPSSALRLFRNVSLRPALDSCVGSPSPHVAPVLSAG
jgi:hypothetical protein